MRAKLHEGAEGLVQLGFSGAGILWWLGTALILILGVQFEVRTTVLGNLFACLVCLVVWLAGHLSGRQVQAFEDAQTVEADAKRDTVGICSQIEQAARLHPAISPGCLQAIRTLCNRISSLPASRLIQAVQPHPLHELLRDLYESLTAREVREPEICLNTERINRQIAPHSLPQDRGTSCGPIDNTRTGD